MFEVKHYHNMAYLLRYPDGYEEGKHYPVILFFHGSGSRGTNIYRLKQNDFFETISVHGDFPFIVAAPLCSENSWFDQWEHVLGMTEELVSSSFCDEDRLYVMGVSMGGYAAWQLAMSRPYLVAALVPICGGGMRWNASRVRRIPVWAHHGEEDPLVPVQESKDMVEAVNTAGGNARLTLYPDMGHEIWVKVYETPEVFSWLLSQKRDLI
ncbi:MAG: dienelactone hydrolase family protein [Clostridia bacterium]|nr:dienelactone hydrolase family protein [Clostridia bacterium]